LVDNQIEVHGDPLESSESPHFREQSIYRGEQCVPLVIDEIPLESIPAKKLLP
jgi:hypothetical protein